MTALRSRTFARNGDEVEARLRAEYGDYHVRDPEATMSDDIVRRPEFLLNRVTFSGTVGMTVTAGSYVSLGAATGICRWRTRKEQGDAAVSAYLVLPGVATTVEITDSVGAGISFLPEALQRMVQRMHADDRLTLTFDSSHPRAPDSGRMLRDMVQFVVAEREAVWESDLVAAAMYRHVAARIIELFPQRNEPVSRPVTSRSLLSGYRRAMRYIDDHASLPLTVEDIAEAAGLPTTQLDVAFRWHSPGGRSTGEVLRDVRLSAAHRDLLAAGRDNTVHAVAVRWGFTPAGFTRAYRGHFGLDPSEVRDGGRRRRPDQPRDTA
ncbi:MULTISPECIES: AraC family transcriptional regulator [Microbacterium]|uniref:helix-turn-helix transcriptional regulator n=1 Tax=Microbacterium TaxID=33882 RepID=UPI00277F3CC5|nr:MULTISPECIES: AraC family transcriptional regulator [Microbacterium]MDQ1085369.1 AraC-like DNA-binding protein [Microbacterium sp. SORGH_AS_0344]MDQ1169326.1 AraC-like DNA-binding protein [Microbacterium proteolyticum]